MGFLGWLVIVAMVYVAVGRTVFVIADGFIRRAWDSIVVVAAAGLIGFVIAYVTMQGLDWRLIIPLTALLVVGSYIAEILASRKLTWQDKKRRKELSRQIRLHLALVTGAIIFSVPFYWLVTTSLKPDERTNVFPPDLIPVQQSSVKIGGEERDVYLLKQGDREIRVAKMAELEGDKWQVAQVAGDGRDYKSRPNDDSGEGAGVKGRMLTVPHADLKPDLHRVLLWSNYSDALSFLPPEYKHGLKPLWNTIYITILTIIGTVLSSSLVAFSFARLRWPGRDVMFVVLLATMMIPAAVTMLPVFLIFRSLGWIDTLRPLWFPALFGSAFNVFLLRQFFMTIPNELEDAAKIDGCGYFTIYWRIMLPLIKPALAAITIFAFMGSWNNFMGPLIYLSSPENMTLAYALQLFQGMHGGEPAMMMAASTLVMLPVLGVFFFTQRYMIQGVTLTGIKG